MSYEDGALSGSMQFQINNPLEKKETAIAILAVYDSNDRLIKIINKNISISQQENIISFDNINFEKKNADAPYKYKFMLWRNFSTLAPLSPNIESSI